MYNQGSILHAVSQIRLTPESVFLAPKLTQKVLSDGSKPTSEGIHVRRAVFDALPEEWSKLCDIIYKCISELDFKLRPELHSTPKGCLDLDELYEIDTDLADRCYSILVRSSDVTMRCNRECLPLREVSRMALSLPKRSDKPHFRNLMKYILGTRFNG